MPIIQEAFNIPDDIAKGLITGQLKRFGGVVRYAVGSNKGRIAKHLDPVNIPDNGDSKGLLQNVSGFIKGHKKITFGALVTVAGIGICYYVKNKEPRVVRSFRQSLRIYLDSVKTGNVDAICIQDLLNSLDAMKLHKEYKEICVKLTAEEMGELVNLICEYTIDLAGKNGVDISENELLVPENQFDAVVVELQRCLETQKKVFDEAA